MNPFNASKATVSKVRRDLGVKVLMYYDTQDIQIHTPTGKCLNPTPNKICTDRDAATGWTRCASGAMPCCFSHECNAYTSTACPEDDYARALASAFDAKWCVNELTPSPPATAATKAMITGAVANAAAAAAAADERVPVCAYGKGPLGCHSAQSNAAMVPFLADWIAGHGYDGVYFDEYVNTSGHANPCNPCTRTHTRHTRPNSVRHADVRSVVLTCALCCWRCDAAVPDGQVLQSVDAHVSISSRH